MDDTSGRAGPDGLGAVLWDMDGLLVDSEPLWTRAEEELAALHGATWSEEIKAAVIGTRMDRAVPIILAGFGVVVDEASVAAASSFLLGRMVEQFRDDPLPLLPGVAALLAELTAAGVPCALVSSSFRVLVDAVLQSLGSHPFVATLGGDEVQHAKPHPEPYLTAAAALGVSPARCVVLEDSLSGARSGLAAGCAVVLAPGATPQPAAGEGWHEVASLADVSLASLRAVRQR